jgi:hypothetical protein
MIMRPNLKKTLIFAAIWGAFVFVSCFLLTIVFARYANATGNETLQGSAQANASGSIYNHANQYNNLFGGYLPSTKFSLDSVTCPTAQFTVGALPNYTHHQLGHQDGVSGVIGLNMPVDFNGTLKRCKQQQAALLRRIETDREFAILSVCKNAAEAGLYLDPQVFPWARYCQGVQLTGPTTREQEQAAALEDLKRQNAALRDQAEKMLAAFGRK